MNNELGAVRVLQIMKSLSYLEVPILSQGMCVLKRSFWACMKLLLKKILETTAGSSDNSRERLGLKQGNMNEIYFSMEYSR